MLQLSGIECITILAVFTRFSLSLAEFSSQSHESATKIEGSLSLLSAFDSFESHHHNDNDRADHMTHRELMWRSLHEFSGRCEQSSRTIVQLFFDFLEYVCTLSPSLCRKTIMGQLLVQR